MNGMYNKVEEEEIMVTKLIDVLIAVVSFLLMLTGTVVALIAIVDFTVQRGIIAVLLILMSWSLTKLWRMIRG